MTFDDLKLLPVPEQTRTHKPIPHHRIIEALIETLGFRHISVVRQEYAATLWSLSNAFTSSFKELKPFDQYKATARLSPFLNRYYQPFEESI
jgi:hypothetical protein